MRIIPVVILLLFIFQKDNFSQSSSFIKQYNCTGIGSASNLPLSNIVTTENQHILSVSYVNKRQLLICLDSTGELNWSKAFICSNCSDTTMYGIKIVKNFNSGFLILSSIPDTPTYSTSITSIDSVGNVIWAKKYNFNTSIFQTSKFFFVGSDSSIFLTTNNKIIKFDKLGTPVWCKNYFTNDTFAYFMTIDIKEISSGFVLIARRIQNDSIGATIESNIGVCKTDLEGNIIWSKYYKGSILDYPYSVDETNDNSLLIAGETFAEGAGWMDMYLMKIDSAGNFKWLKTYGDSLYSSAYFVKEIEANKIILAGDGSRDAFPNDYDIIVMELDSVGNINSFKSYGDSNRQTFKEMVKINSTNNFLIYSYLSPFKRLLIKIDESLNTSCLNSNINFTVDSLVFAEDTMSMSFDTILITQSNINITTRPPTSFLITDYCQLSNQSEQKASEFEINVFPNPFTEDANISFTLKEEAIISIELYSVLGQKESLVNSIKHGKGDYLYNINSPKNKLRPGIYFVRMFINNKTITKKIVRVE